MRVTVAKRLRTNDKSSTFRRSWIDHARLGSGLNNNAGAGADAASCGARNSGVSLAILKPDWSIWVAIVCA